MGFAQWIFLNGFLLKPGQTGPATLARGHESVQAIQPISRQPPGPIRWHEIPLATSVLVQKFVVSWTLAAQHGIDNGGLTAFHRRHTFAQYVIELGRIVDPQADPAERFDQFGIIRTLDGMT